MNMWKQNARVAALFLLLATVAAAPLALLRLQNSRLPDGRHVEALAPESLWSGQAAAVSESAAQRLQRTRQSVMVESDASSVVKISAASDEEKGELLLAMERELLSLQEAGALPDFRFTSSCEAIISKRSYLENAGAVSLWAIDAEYADLSLRVFMDTRTGTLYEVQARAKKSEFFYAEAGVSSQSFLEYLQIPPGSLDAQGKEFAAQGYYDVRTAFLFIVSRDAATQTLTSYRLDDDVKYTLVSEPPGQDMEDKRVSSTVLP